LILVESTINRKLFLRSGRNNLKMNQQLVVLLFLVFLAHESASFRITSSARIVGARGTNHDVPASLTSTTNSRLTRINTTCHHPLKPSTSNPLHSLKIKLTTAKFAKPNKSTKTNTDQPNYDTPKLLQSLLVPTLSLSLPPYIPKYLPLSLLHILGGTTGTPIVLRATKSWYKRISLPPWIPPNSIFGPVWTTLYGLMGYSLHRISPPAAAAATIAQKAAIKAWSLHYLLNLSWAPFFFGFQCLRTGLVINLLLLTSLALAVLPLFHSIDPLAAYAQLPYLAWLVYATVLNREICRLNPMVGGVNEAMVQADLCAGGGGEAGEYNEAMLEYDLKKLQKAAARYAGL